MRKLIVVVTLVAAPLAAAAPAAAATAAHPAAGSGNVAVVTSRVARDGLAHPPAAPLTPQAREGATSRPSVEKRYGDETAVLPRHHLDDAETATACFAAPATPAHRASAGSALARAPPESA